MAIIANPNKQDRKNRTCTHWRVVLFDKETGKRLPTETFIGTREAAQEYEKKLKGDVSEEIYKAPSERLTLAQVCADFIKDQTQRGNAPSTVLDYQSVFNHHLIPQFGTKTFETITRKNFRAFQNLMLERGCTPHTISKVTRYAITLWNFAVDEDLVKCNLLISRRKARRLGRSAKVKRGAYAEADMQAIIAASTARERALVGLLAFTGIRPGELYALRYLDLKLPEQSACIRRSWSHRGNVMKTPKTEAGIRAVSLSAWLIEQLEEHRRSSGETLDSEALIFPSGRGTPLNPSNVRRDIWLPLIKRAGVKYLDMYSLRHTFATFARASGAEGFNVSRHLGHARSIIVDTIYAETLPSGLKGMSDRVTARTFNHQPPANTPMSSAVTHPLHKIIGGGNEAALMVCSNEDFFMEAAND